QDNTMEDDTRGNRSKRMESDNEEAQRDSGESEKEVAGAGAGGPPGLVAGEREQRPKKKKVRWLFYDSAQEPSDLIEEQYGGHLQWQMSGSVRWQEEREKMWGDWDM